MKKILLLLFVLALLFPPSTPARAADQPPATNRQLPRWQQLFPASSPPPRSEPGLAYDSARRVAVMFGGYDGDARDDTWEWESEQGTWVERFPIHRPPARFGAAMAYDEARSVAVMFGGTNDYYADYGDTWLWDGNDWTQVFPANAPSPRWLHAMTYDIQRQVVLLFGGTKAWQDANTWEWDGSNWVAPDIIEPSWRYGVALAYDSRRGVTVLFGGDEGAGWYFFDDTWERPGVGDWTQRYPQKHPEHRESATAAYFPRLRSVILYGGYNLLRGRFSDTWAWTGRKWIKLPFNPHPAGGGGGMAYDTTANGLLLYVSVSETGERIGETWLLC